MALIISFILFQDVGVLYDEDDGRRKENQRKMGDKLDCKYS